MMIDITSWDGESSLSPSPYGEREKANLSASENWLRVRGGRLRRASLIGRSGGRGTEPVAAPHPRLTRLCRNDLCPLPVEVQTTGRGPERGQVPRLLPRAIGAWPQ
jgi:hypothetical protein